MQNSAFEAEGFAFYVSELRKGSTDPYVAYRVYEKNWQLARGDRGLLRDATIRLIEADPWFLATAMPHFLSALETQDLERLTPFVGAGQPRHTTATLRAMLWFHGRKGPHHPDRAGRVQLQRALAFLQDVPRKQRDLAWHEMLVGCYRVLDFAEYKRAFPKLFKLTAPEWRASTLHSFLREVASKKDWKAYDRFRPEWDRLQKGHHACECYLNGVYTDDGLRAVAARNWSAVPEALRKAADVRGCPHLNTGGMRLDLARLLFARKKLLAPAREYLERAEGAGFGGQKDVRRLRRNIDDLLRRA